MQKKSRVTTNNRRLAPLDPPPQVTRPLHEFLILMLLHLQLALPLHGDEEHLERLEHAPHALLSCSTRRFP